MAQKLSAPNGERKIKTRLDGKNVLSYIMAYYPKRFF